jgi:hypothetical protein
MASFLTKPKTKSETSSSNLQVQFKEIPNEDVGQDEQSLKCSKLTLIWKNENKLESLHIIANLHVHSSVHFFHNIFNIGIIIIS